MAFIDGSYSTAATLLKDLARAVCTANKVLEPYITEEEAIVDANLEIVLTHKLHTEDLNPITALPEEVTFKNDLGVDITPGFTWNSNEPRKIVFTDTVLENDVILVTYKHNRDADLVVPVRRQQDDQGVNITTYAEQLADQLSRIESNGKFVIRMDTTPIDSILPDDPFGTMLEHGVTDTSMYVEFYKPEFVINPETGRNYTIVGDNKYKFKNNHYMLIRMIDKFDEVLGLPAVDAVPSNWAKYAWMLDFKEEYTDVGTGEVKSHLEPLPLPEFYDSGDLIVRFYTNCDNDKINLVIVGNRDIAVDDYLMSYAYIGKIKSFINENTGTNYSVDVVGNFALTVGSSTMPVATPAPYEAPIEVDTFDMLLDIQNATDPIIPELGMDGNAAGHYDRVQIHQIIENELDSYYGIHAPNIRVTYRVSFANDQVETPASEPLSSTIFKELYTVNGVDLTVPSKMELTRERAEDYVSVDYQMIPKLQIKVPEEFKDNITKIRIYKCENEVHNFDSSPWLIDLGQQPGTFLSQTPSPNEEAIPSDTEKYYLLEEIELQEGDIDGENMFYYEDLLANQSIVPNQEVANTEDYVRIDSETETAVIRDENTGFIIRPIFSNRFGENTTATGVNDIMMYKTRMGSYYQKHAVAFMSPDEFLRKPGFNTSAYTDRVHLTPVYIVHGGDGYRGELIDVLFIDKTNMRNGDILIINEGQPDEMKYKFFKINQPFGCLNASSAYDSGVAIKYLEY